MTARLAAIGTAALIAAGGGALAPATAAAALPPIKHVFVIVEENESEATSFGATSPAPYLSKTLVSQGAFVPNYYGIGHASLDNYIAMISGQAPNPMTSADCPVFADFAAPTSLDASGQETGKGCVYPANVPSLPGQLDSAKLSWRAYEDSMGADPTRESATCGHPALGTPDLTEAQTPTDQYATRHDPFMYFHYVIDNAAECNANVVNLSRLATDLQSAATTPNYTFITPGVCDDGHDAKCANGGPGGLPQADAFLQTWVPKITSSPAFQQDGLLMIIFDEASGDSTACCGELPGPYDAANGIQPGGNGPGGGDVGAVLLSPYINPGTVSANPYNHYSMLGTVEDIFGLPRLADAAGTTAFGADVFNRPPQLSALKLAPAKFATRSRRGSHTHRGTVISYTDSVSAITTVTVQQLLSRHRTRRIGSFTHTDVAGANRISFSGRLGRRALAAGRYTLTAAPAAGSLTGTPVSAGFRVVNP